MKFIHSSTFSDLTPGYSFAPTTPTQEDIIQYCDYLAQQKKKDRWTTRLMPRYSLNSQYAALIALKSFFGWLQQHSYIAQNPTYNR